MADASAAQMQIIRVPDDAGPPSWSVPFFALVALFAFSQGALVILCAAVFQEGLNARNELIAERTKAAVHEESATRWHKLYDELLERIGPTPRRPTGAAGSAGNIGKAP